MPGIKGLLETSFLDWPGRVCAVFFMGGCNFRCPFCHNHPLVLGPDEFESITLDDARNRLGPFRKWLGGICVSGGEPTLDPALPSILGKLKEDGWAVKLDTNGSRPGLLADLIRAGLLDMIAMDVKAPLVEEKYNRCAGVKVDLDRVKASISLIRKSGLEHEFRMTVAPLFHSEADIREWVAYLGPESSLKLQNFNPRTTLDPQLSSAEAFPPERFERFQQLLS